MGISHIIIDKITPIWNNLPFGYYPKEYKPEIHGRYDPSRYYGTPDTEFGNVKLGELGAWIRRREKGPASFVALISRAHWRWQFNYVQPLKAGAAPWLQMVISMSALFYCINYLKIRHHAHYKYH